MTPDETPRATLREDERVLADGLVQHCSYALHARCICGWHADPSLGNWPEQHAAHVAEQLAPVVEAARAEEREQWASWLESWLGAVCPKLPTPEAILGWLRADQRPFGTAQGRTALDPDQADEK